MNKIRLLTLGSLLFAISVPAYAKVYQCPEYIDSKPAEVKAPPELQVWHEPQALKNITAIDLYDGHPREMASLEPDNGDDAKAESSFWTLGYKPHGDFWMVCRYKNTDIRLIGRIDKQSKFCKEYSTVMKDGQQNFILECK